MRCLLAILFVTGAIVQLAPAQVITLYDTTGDGLHDNPFGPAAMLDDLNVAVGPVQLTAMEFGYHNTGSDEDVDALVTFWDNMNVNATSSTVVNTGNLASFRRHIGVVPDGGVGTTGLFNLPSIINVPDDDFGVQIQFVLTNTNTLSSVEARLSDILPTIGTTADKYWSDDQSPGGSFQGMDAVSFNPGNPTVHENLYLRIDGTVPEPASIAGLVAMGFMSLGRRRSTRAAAHDAGM